MERLAPRRPGLVWQNSPKAAFVAETQKKNLFSSILKSNLFRYIIYICMCFYFYFFNMFLFINLAVLSLSCSIRTLSCSMWDLVPWPGIKPGPPALGAWNHSHWTTREGPFSFFFLIPNLTQHVFHGGSDGKKPTCNAGDLGLIPGSGRCPGEGNGNPFQYSCLENSMDRGTWQSTVQGLTQSWTWLSD